MSHASECKLSTIVPMCCCIHDNPDKSSKTSCWVQVLGHPEKHCWHAVPLAKVSKTILTGHCRMSGQSALGRRHVLLIHDGCGFASHKWSCGPDCSMLHLPTPKEPVLLAHSSQPVQLPGSSTNTNSSTATVMKHELCCMGSRRRVVYRRRVFTQLMASGNDRKFSLHL